jgi:monofunctional biosynthetic peptidoglycan transglycosylase
MRSLAVFAFRAVGTALAAVAAMLVLFAVVPLPGTAFTLRWSLTHGSAASFDWEPAERISPHLLLALVASEDQRFADHHGFDWEAIRKAASEQEHGGRLRGASTISQQVAKNLFLWPERTWLRKGLETVLTGMVELVWSKRRILEVYANVAEMGDGIFGAEAASEHFFHKPAASLTTEEAALLVAVLPNPKAFKANAPSPQVRRRQQWIVGQMAAMGGPAWLRRVGIPASR